MKIQIGYDDVFILLFLRFACQKKLPLLYVVINDILIIKIKL